MRIFLDGVAQDTGTGVDIGCGSNPLVDYDGERYALVWKSGVAYWGIRIPETGGAVDTASKVKLDIPPAVLPLELSYDGSDHTLLAKDTGNALYFIRLRPDLKKTGVTQLTPPTKALQSAAMCNGPLGTAFIVYTEGVDSIGPAVVNAYRAKGLLHRYAEVGAAAPGPDFTGRCAAEFLRRGTRDFAFRLFIPPSLFQNAAAAPVRIDLFDMRGKAIHSRVTRVKTGTHVTLFHNELAPAKRLSMTLYFVRISVANRTFVAKYVAL